MQLFQTPDEPLQSGMDFYWQEDLGLFFSRSRFWENYNILQSSNPEKNALLQGLVKGVYPKIEQTFQQAEAIENSLPKKK